MWYWRVSSILVQDSKSLRVCAADEMRGGGGGGCITMDDGVVAVRYFEKDVRFFSFRFRLDVQQPYVVPGTVS
jgi:hypothetical protein